MSILQCVSDKFTEEELKISLERLSASDNVTIKSIKAGNNSGKKGDSYLSVIHRFIVEATGKSRDKEDNISIPIIVKGFPKNLARRKTFRSPDFFDTEINFYSNVWPLMKKLKESRNINEPNEVPLHVSSFSDGKSDYIALKDLSFEGYGTIERGSGVDQEYASLFLKLLANFHALSISAKQQNPKFQEAARSLKETYYDERFRGWYAGFMQKKLYEIVRNAVKTQLEPSYLERCNTLFSTDFYGWRNTQKKGMDLLKNYSSIGFEPIRLDERVRLDYNNFSSICLFIDPNELLCELVKRSSSKLSAVTQGDAWLPNFLLKFENGKPAHAILIDFQLARYAPVTGDLVQFLYSCISQELLLCHWDDLVEEYHKYLSERIDLLGGDKNFITLEDLREDIQKHGHIGIAMALESAVMSSLEDDEVPDLDMIQGDEAVPLEAVWDISPFKDEPRNKKVAFILKHAIERNFI